MSLFCESFNSVLFSSISIPNRLTPHILTELADLSEDLLGVSRDSWGFADEWSKLKANKDILFKHRIKNSLFFYFVFKL